MEAPLQPTTTTDDSSREDLKHFLLLFLRNWYWLALSLLIAGTLAWLKLRYATNIYQVSGSILVEDSQQKSFSEEALVEDLGFSSAPNVEDQLQVLKSTSLMRRVVDSLNLHITYLTEGRIKTSEAYTGSPVHLTDIDSLEMAYGTTLRLRPLDSLDFVLIRSESDTLNCRFGVPFSYEQNTFTVDWVSTPDNRYVHAISIQDPERVARNYAGALSLQQVGRSNVITLGLKDAVPNKAIDIITTLIQEYNRSQIEEKNRSGTNTLAFIDERLRFVTEELYDVEKEVEGFRRSRDISVELSTKAEGFLDRVSTVDEQIMELDLQLDMLTTMLNLVRDDSKRYRSLPVSSQILSPSLGKLTEEYNAILIERDKLRESARPDNPAFRKFDEQIDYLRGNLQQSLETLQREFTKRRATLQERLRPIERQINSIPTNERELLQIMRQQQIKEQLFLFLLQKREETALSIAAQTGSTRILDKPSASSLPIEPKRRQIYLIALFLGLAIPGGIIYLLDALNDKLYSRQDIQRATATPFLGLIGQARREGSIVVSKGSRSAVSEMFRLLRTNLQFLAAGDSHQVTLVTSSVSGEGKSFITINLGISQALSGKKTILVGLDLRKPKLSEYLLGDLSPWGVTSFLVGDTELKDLIKPVPHQTNVDYLDCGPIPPNPAELLMSPRTTELFAYLRQHYDCILVDTSPVGLVTDALLLKDHVDQSIIVTRFGRTRQAFLRVIEDIYQNGKLPRLGIVLNGVKARGGYGYGYGGYGYGYGYGGYGYGYYEEEKKGGKKGSWWPWGK
ncbi:MAG: polysaccharide biosynthesis tyrosine autokinase [Lewinellaceae bacterium]|nr:polysaccharide biosynthesis tyrosine autokinase [Lewinellaceae bacterium]